MMEKNPIYMKINGFKTNNLNNQKFIIQVIENTISNTTGENYRDYLHE